MVIFFALNSGVAHHLSKDLTNNKRSKFHWVCGMRDQSFDIAYVGSSRVEMMVDPRVIDAKLNTISINIGASGGGAGDQFLLASHLLNQNDVRAVLFQVDYLSLADKFSYPFKDYIWLCYDANSDVQQALIDHRGYLRYAAWKYVPFLKLMEFSSQYRLFSPGSDGRYWVERKGGQQQDIPFDPSRRDDPAVYVPKQLPTAYVRRTIELCLESKVRTILFQAPCRASLSEVSQFPKCSELVQQIAAEYELTYWDFFDLYADEPELFYDNHHLNSEGVRRFSAELAEHIHAANLTTSSGTDSGSR